MTGSHEVTGSIPVSSTNPTPRARFKAGFFHMERCFSGKEPALSIKDRVLEVLEQNKGADISGQEIADALGVSRNSVWKAISALRDEGYTIDSSTNRGYKLSGDNDILSSPAIEAAFGQEHPGFELVVEQDIDSTQDEAKRMLSNGFCGLGAVVAAHQSGGHGRRGRSFFSPKGGAYVSIIMQNKASTADAVLITMAAAVATSRAIAKTCVSKPEIKWVNDIYVEGKKVCGILTEGITDLETNTIQNVVVGIGVNVGEQEFPEDIASRAGYVVLREGFTRNDLVASIIDNLLELSTLENGLCEEKRKPIAEEYRSLSFVPGLDIEYELGEGTVRAHALDIDDWGGLVVEDEDGKRSTLRAGEISIRF